MIIGKVRAMGRVAPVGDRLTKGLGAQARGMSDVIGRPEMMVGSGEAG